ncbi:MAG: hypothetical protein PUD42_05235 [Clostridiales bacterium]|nr:hypothetical protein [Clostridiales bacterium]
MRKYICIIGIFILNLQLYNITYASVNDESGIGVEITSSEDNQSIEINLKNASEHNYKNVSVNVELPEELKISDNVSLDVEELTSNKEINKNITLGNDTTKGNNKLIFIVVLGIVVLLAFVVTFLIFKN